MSQYTIIIPKNSPQERALELDTAPEDISHRILAYGYDRMGNPEYFLHVTNITHEGDESSEFAIGTSIVMTPHPNYPHKNMWRRMELRKFLVELGKQVYVPQKHLDSIALDLPF